MLEAKLIGKCLTFFLLAGSAFAQYPTPIHRFIYVVLENRTADEIMGSWGLPNFPGYPTPASPTGSCQDNAGGGLLACSNAHEASGCNGTTCTVALTHANPASSDAALNDLPHARWQLAGQINSGAMTGAGGFCQSGTTTALGQCTPISNSGCSGGGTCSMIGTSTQPGPYSYVGCSDVPAFCRWANVYAVAGKMFPKQTPSAPSHLFSVSGQSYEWVENPYTPCQPGSEWGAAAATTNPTTCSSGGTSFASATGAVYYSQVVSQSISGTTVNGTSVATGHYYVGGLLSGGGSCLADLSTTEPHSLSSSYTISDGGAHNGATCTIAQCNGQTYGCIGVPHASVTTVMDEVTLSSSCLGACSWGIYGPLPGTTAPSVSDPNHGGALWNVGTYTDNYFNGTWTANLYSETTTSSAFDAAVNAGTLPNFVILTPPQSMSCHPANAVYGSGTLASCMVWLESRLSGCMEHHANCYDNSIIVITFDDGGGFYDHLAVPSDTTSLGYGPRVPFVLISPYAAPGVNNTVYGPISILRCADYVLGINDSWVANPNSEPSICPSGNTGLVNWAANPLPPLLPAPTVVRQRIQKEEPDVETLVAKAWQHFFPRRRERQEVDEQPELKVRPVCWGETWLDTNADYIHAVGPGKVETVKRAVCRNNDLSLVLRPYENPMDDDDLDVENHRARR